MAGADDPATPPEHLATIAGAVPGARLLVLPQAAHLADVGQATAVNAALLGHLDPAGTTGHERGMQVRRAVLGHWPSRSASSPTWGLDRPAEPPRAQEDQ